MGNLEVCCPLLGHRLVVLKVMLICWRNCKERYNRSLLWKFELNAVFTCWANSKKLSKVFSQEREIQSTFSEVTACCEHISGRSIRKRAPTLKNFMYESFLRFNCFGLENYPNHLEREPFLKIDYTINSCSASHKNSKYFVEYLPSMTLPLNFEKQRPCNFVYKKSDLGHSHVFLAGEILHWLYLKFESTGIIFRVKFKITVVPVLRWALKHHYKLIKKNTVQSRFPLGLRL